ncbi:MAG: hypothetical protein ACLQVW_05775 [Limisphaerales bacterium]
MKLMVSWVLSFENLRELEEAPAVSVQERQGFNSAGVGKAGHAVQTVGRENPPSAKKQSQLHLAYVGPA